MVEHSNSFSTFDDDCSTAKRDQNDDTHQPKKERTRTRTTMSETAIMNSTSVPHENKAIVYLNNAGQAQLTPEVQQAGLDAISKPPWETPAEDPIMEASIQQSFATLIDCSDPSDIVMVPNTAYAISLAALNVQRTVIDTGIRSRGTILLLQDQFDSAVYPWQQMCDASNGNITLNIVPYPTSDDDDDGWTPGILERLSDNVIAACLPPLHWSDGSLIDLEAIGSKCRKHEIALIVDATQAVGIMPVSVTKIQAALLACSVHKVRIRTIDFAKQHVYTFFNVQLVIFRARLPFFF
jgi:selenocysteine lyase/cysteine desulfurase